MSMNKILLLGRLGKDPELRYTPSQVAVCKFSLATSEKRKDQTGNYVEQTEWHNIVVFGKVAELCNQYLKKGRQAFIEGRIQTRKWQDKEGKDRYTTEIIAGSVQFLGGRDSSDSAGDSASYEKDNSSPHSDDVLAGQALVASLASADSLAGSSSIASTSFDDDDIPF